LSLRSINILQINDPKSGQFERTLIITEKNSQVNYLEGCTAPQYDTNQLRCRCRTALENATIKYSTVQNWYSGNEFGKGGVYNFVTKRGCVQDQIPKYHGLKLKQDQLLLGISKLFTCR
jgi:Fe-S cluster assembly protein SufB